MSKSTITLTTDQQALLKDGKVMLCVPLRKQPPDGWSYGFTATDGVLFHDPKGYPAHEYILLQYPIGTVLMVEGTDTHVKVVDVRVCRVQKVGCNNILQMGIIEDISNGMTKDEQLIFGLSVMDTFFDWFNTKYAKPRVRRKNGEIVGYECWCYELNQTVLEKYKYVEFGFKHEEPLKIYPDPFVELTTLEAKW